VSSLAGRRVVVTRAAEQADELASLLEASGAVPVVVPLVTIETDTAEAARLRQLDPNAVDWLLVTSPNGARHYLAQHGAVSPPDVAAVGTATADILRAGGVRVTLVPARQNAAGLLEVLPAGPRRAVLVQAATAHPELADGLSARGWTTTVVAPYRTVPTRPDAGLQLAALAADAVLFASGSAASAWVEVFGTTAPPLIVAIGPRTAENCHKAGLKVQLVASDHSLPGLVLALERHLAGDK
jgi:uroporphyrinogen-III synthase